MAHRGGGADPENHCAFNVVLFGDGGKRWTMTERGRGALDRSAETIRIGPSRAFYRGDMLVLEVEERSTPFFQKVKGRIEITPDRTYETAFALDAEGRHVWRPVAPSCRIAVELESPALRWTGRAYWDMNEGERQVDADFLSWQWSRALCADGPVLFYDVVDRSGAMRSLALRFAPDGRIADIPPPPMQRGPLTGWRMERPYRSETTVPPSGITTVEDTPFYARSLVAQRLFGETVTAVHESLSVTRFASPVVQAMLPWRMPRRR
jgi:carotenoid 1,2-hydratase